MAETTTENIEREKYFKLEEKNEALAKQVDKLFFEWWDDSYKLRRRDENFSADESLDRLAAIVKGVRSTVVRFGKEKEVSDFGVRFDEFMNGDSDAAIAILKNRGKEDPISKIMWLINVTTSVAVLSKAVDEPLDKGPLARRKITVKNVEQMTVPIPNSVDMKTPSKFLGEVLPKTFAAVAKHSHLAKAAGKRAAFTGTEYHNIATMDSMYYDLGQALIFVSTDFFAEANRALTENGKRQSVEKVKNFNFNKLSSKEQDKMMQTMAASFRKYANYTADLNMFSNINDKMILDSVLCAYYEYFDDNKRNSCGFSENQLRSLPNALAFSRKFTNEYQTAYNRYSNKFMDGMYDAVVKEEKAVKKEWFENKITGEKVFRRGRLVGHGNKFMHTGPMEWLDKKLKEKSWISPIWLLPKLGMTALKIATHPNVRKLRKKLTGTLFAALRAFASGVKESFDKTGRSTEITYDDVIKALKEGEEKLRKINSEKVRVANESFDRRMNKILFEAEDEQTEENSTEFTDEDAHFIDDILPKLEDCEKKYKAAMSDEALDKDREAYESACKEIAQRLETDLGQSVMNAEYTLDADDHDTADLITKARSAITDFIEHRNEYKDAKNERDDLDKSNAKDKKDSDKTLQVGEKSVKICEDVYAVLNKYIARQWNLFALHSSNAKMPLCARYITVDMDQPVNGAAAPSKQKKEDEVKKESVSKTSDMTLTEWLTLHEADEKTDDETLAKQKSQQANLGTIDRSLKGDRTTRDNRENANHNGQLAAEYPFQYNGKYRYHGIELQAAEGHADLNGFGVFVERLTKIAKPVKSFLEFVEQLGNESASKTFDNSKKDKPVNPFESFVNPYDLLMNEDIANKVFKGIDKATDFAGDLAKKPIKGAGYGVGYALGKLAHGITHTGTADKNQSVEKTVENNFVLEYSYSKSLRLSYVKDGANILKRNCLTDSAKKQFGSIVTLADALGKANFANAFSIKAISDALETFADAMSGVDFKPCKSIVSYELAQHITQGKLADGENPAFGVVKGLYISNYEAAKEYSRELTGEEIDQQVADKQVDPNDLSPEQQKGIKDREKARTDQAKKEQDLANARAEMQKNAERYEKNKKFSKEEISQMGGKVMDAAQWNSLGAEARQQWVKSGKAFYPDGQRRTSINTETEKAPDPTAKRDQEEYNKQQAANLNASAEVDISGLSKLFENLNKIDWKEVL